MRFARALTASRRALSAAATPLHDRVLLRGMVFYAYHGNLPEERVLGQRFEVDVEMRADLSAAGRSDDVADTVDYAAAYDAVRAEVEGTPHNLIETVAANVASRLLSEHARVEEVTVQVRKPEVCIRGVLAHAAIEIRRSRSVD